VPGRAWRVAGELQGGGRAAAGERERGAWPEKRSGRPAGRWATDGDAEERLRDEGVGATGLRVEADGDAEERMGGDSFGMGRDIFWDEFGRARV
jgi:hypothetical protein